MNRSHTKYWQGRIREPWKIGSLISHHRSQWRRKRFESSGVKASFSSNMEVVGSAISFTFGVMTTSATPFRSSTCPRRKRGGLLMRNRRSCSTHPSLHSLPPSPTNSCRLCILCTHPSHATVCVVTVLHCVPTARTPPVDLHAAALIRVEWNGKRGRGFAQPTR